jgi:hypothetical protein
MNTFELSDVYYNKLNKNRLVDFAKRDKINGYGKMTKRRLVSSLRKKVYKLPVKVNFEGFVKKQSDFFLKQEDCTVQQTKQFIEIMNKATIRRLIEFITEQKFSNTKSYASFQIDTKKGSVEDYKEIKTRNIKEHLEVFVQKKESVKFQSPTIPSLKRLLERSKERSIVIPVTYTNNKLDSDHFAAILINNNRSGYLIDSNGMSDYFDIVHDKDYNKHIEEGVRWLLKQIDVKYIPLEKWNRRMIPLNGKFNNSYIGDGHCVSIALLIIFYCVTMDLSPSKVYKSLCKMSDEELLYLITEFNINAMTVLI